MKQDKSARKRAERARFAKALKRHERLAKALKTEKTKPYRHEED